MVGSSDRSDTLFRVDAPEFAGRRNSMRSARGAAAFAGAQSDPRQHSGYYGAQTRGRSAAGKRGALAQPGEQRDVRDLLGDAGQSSAGCESAVGANAGIRV